jgi:hypothetical protein
MNSLTPQEQKVASVVALWKELLPFTPPDQYLINVWVLTHGLDTVLYAVKEVALKRVKLNGDLVRDVAIRLCGAICCNVAKQRAHNAAQATR